MNPNEELIQKFYSSFQKKDWKGMQECYHPELIFNDSVFKNLKKKKASAMWHMLLEGGKDLELTFDGIQADDNSGKAHWIATYTFSKTGNKVINDIHASFEIKDGKIFRHTDKFDFHNWSKQALGLPGLLFGKFKFLQNKVTETATKTLNKFIQQHPEKYS